MRVVYSPRHLQHEPRHEFADGEAIGIFEVPERAETIRRSLEADGGFTIEPPSEHGSAPITAVHDPAMLAYLEDSWRDGENVRNWLLGLEGRAMDLSALEEV